jgi:hypothetical protein
MIGNIILSTVGYGLGILCALCGAVTVGAVATDREPEGKTNAWLTGSFFFFMASLTITFITKLMTGV